MRVFWEICVISAVVISSVSAIINNYAIPTKTSSIYRLSHKGVNYGGIVKKGGTTENGRMYIVPKDWTLLIGYKGGKQELETTQEVISTSGQIKQSGFNEKSSVHSTNSLDTQRRILLPTVGQHANQFPGINHVKIGRDPQEDVGASSKNPPPQYINIRPSFVSHAVSADKGIPENHPNSHLSPNIQRILPIQSSPQPLFYPEQPLLLPEQPLCELSPKLGIHERHPPPNPYVQLALSHYGHHGWPLFYGHQFGGLYGYGAANDIHNNQPVGSYKVTEEYD
ncbi:hypothetical protein DMENIID0001_026020 [Sergentomyia squamirostris]